MAQEPGEANHEARRDAEAVAVLQRHAVSLKLLDHPRSAKHRGKHQRGHAATVVGIDLGKVVLGIATQPRPAISFT